MQTKICTKCENELPATTEYFNKHKLGKYGLNPVCKQCRKDIQNSTSNHKIRQKRYYQNHKKEIKIKSNNYRKNNLHIYRESTKKYYKTDEGKMLKVKIQQKRESLKLKLKSDFTLIQWQKCKQFFNNKCAYCDKEKKLQQEHFIPLSKDGEYTKNNIIPACGKCNSSKGNKDFFKWYSKQEFYSKEREQKILKYLNYDNKTKP